MSTFEKLIRRFIVDALTADEAAEQRQSYTVPRAPLPPEAQAAVVADKFVAQVETEPAPWTMRGRVIRMALAPPPFVLTLWHPDGIRAAWAAAKPIVLSELHCARVQFAGGIMLRGNVADLCAHGPALTKEIKGGALLSAWHAYGAETCPVWWSVDERNGLSQYPNSAAIAEARRAVTHEAYLARVAVLFLDEGLRWMTEDTGFRASEISRFVQLAHAECPELVVALTGFGTPAAKHAHDGVDAWGMLVAARDPIESMYAATANDSGEWQRARGDRRVNGAVTWPVVVGHKWYVSELGWLRDGFETVILESEATERQNAPAIDERVNIVVRALSRLAMAGSFGVGCISRYQYDAGLDVTGELDALTLARLQVDA